MTPTQLPVPDKPFADYAARNAAPILEVLSIEFANARQVLEIGSGTGQHGAAFVEALTDLTWQTSDLDENHDGIKAWVAHADNERLLPPLSLDVRTASVPETAYDGVFSANTAHIMSIEAVCRTFELIGATLRDAGIFCLYGPFRIDGEFNTESNAAFDRTLRGRDPDMGIRDLETLDKYGRDNDMTRRRLYAMPANNNIAVWRRDAR